jgi:antitoxin CptB
MIGTTLISQTQLNTIRWQCRRGMLELDILLLGFFDKHYQNLRDELQNHFIDLLAESDQALYDCLVKKDRHPLPHLQNMIERILLSR